MKTEEENKQQNGVEKNTVWDIILKLIIAIAGVLTGITAKAMNVVPWI